MRHIHSKINNPLGFVQLKLINYFPKELLINVFLHDSKDLNKYLRKASESSKKVFSEGYFVRSTQLYVIRKKNWDGSMEYYSVPDRLYIFA